MQKKAGAGVTLSPSSAPRTSCRATLPDPQLAGCSISEEEARCSIRTREEICSGIASSGFQVKRASKLRYRERLTPESYSRHVAALAGDRYLETVPIHLREDVRRAFVGEASKLCGPGPTLKDCATVIFAVKSDGWTTGAWS